VQAVEQAFGGQLLGIFRDPVSGRRYRARTGPLTDQGFIDALSTAIHHTARRPSVVSVSWASSEDSWTGQARSQMEQIFTEGAARGVTGTVAAGDNGSTDAVGDGQQHVDFPASAPHALACGGTTLNASGATISSEIVWTGRPTTPPAAGSACTGLGSPDGSALATELGTGLAAGTG
jgi:kumamolisin